MIHFVSKAFLCVILATNVLSCAKKSMSERDTRREQLRLNAHKKRIELAPLVGNYRGSLQDAQEYKQDIFLRIELKDEPETENGQIDPVLVPTLNGSFSLTYGTGQGVELVNFSSSKTDFNPSSNRLNMVVSNDQLKDISLSLIRENGGFEGSWVSATASSNGTLKLSQTNDLNLGGETPPIKGSYSGLFEWNSMPVYADGSLTMTTAQDSADGLHLSANVKIFLHSLNANETFSYEFGAIEFNPLTRQLSFRSDTSDVYMIGRLINGSIIGSWYSKKTGLLGNVTFKTASLGAPAEKKLAFSASGSWAGSIVNTHPSSNLPPRITMSFNGVPNPESSGGFSLLGSARIYFGPFGSDEYIEYRFDSIDYQPFSRKLVAVGLGSASMPKLTFQMDMLASSLEGKIFDASLGEVATVKMTQSVTTDSLR